MMRADPVGVTRHRKLQLFYKCLNKLNRIWSQVNFFVFPECAFTGPKTEACGLCGPQEGEQGGLPSRVVHPQHAGHTRAGHAS